MTSSGRPSARLTPLQLGDADLLAEAVDELVRADAELRSLAEAVMSLQEQLRRCASPEAWNVYLVLEEASNSRAGLLLLLVTRWAFEEGRRWEAGER